MSLNLITTQLLNSKISVPADEYQIVNPSEIDELIALLNQFKNKKLTIYDVTRNTEFVRGHAFPVNDHINRTGSNPLIGRQVSAVKNNFIDMSNLYQKTDEGVITACLGSSFQDTKTFDFPSAYLCNISIIARAIGIKIIKAFLINF